MKTKTILLLAVAIFTNLSLRAAGGEEGEGTSCETAITIFSNTTENFTFIEGQNELYLQFTAGTNDESFAISDDLQLHSEIISEISLYEKGACEEVIFIKNISYLSYAPANNMLLDNLQNGTEYLIKLKKNVALYPGNISFYVSLRQIVIVTTCPVSAGTPCESLTQNPEFSYVKNSNLANVNYRAFLDNHICHWGDAAPSADFYVNGTNTYAGLLGQNYSSN
ncbi:MAG: hypothetical protein JKY48_16550 [Flavobacteriales bacterium]|nr:hypothetical protein [Flavobacteriales bacterium]